jgi:hypothetical protein
MKPRDGIARYRDRPFARRRATAIAAAVLCALAPARLEAAPANTLREMGGRFQACLAARRGGGDESPDSQITIVFALKRDGSLLGRPRISHSDLRGDLDDQKRFVAGAIAAIEACLPLDVTPGLGGAIAGRPIAFRITGGKRRFGI